MQRIVLLFLGTLALVVPHPSNCLAGEEQAEANFRKRHKMVAEDIFSEVSTIALCHAIEANDLDEIKRCVAEGADVNARGKWGVTPLFWAFPSHRLERFELLLELGADPNLPLTERPDRGFAFSYAPGFTVTIAAAQTEFKGYFKAVLEHGGDLTLEDPISGPMLHTIISGQYPFREERIEMYLKHGGDLNVRNQESGTHAAFYAASYQEQYELALWLLEKGIDPHIPITTNYPDSTFATYLANEESQMLEKPLVFQVGYLELVAYLVQHGVVYEDVQRDFIRRRAVAESGGLPPGETEYFFKHRFEDVVRTQQEQFREATKAMLETYDRSTEDGRQRWDKDYQKAVKKSIAILEGRKNPVSDVADKKNDTDFPYGLEWHHFYTEKLQSWKYGEGLRVYVDVIPKLLGTMSHPQLQDRLRCYETYADQSIKEIDPEASSTARAALWVPWHMPATDTRLNVEFHFDSPSNATDLDVYISEAEARGNGKLTIEEGGSRITMSRRYRLCELEYNERGLIDLWVRYPGPPGDRDQNTSADSLAEAEVDHLHTLSATLTGVPNFDPPTGSAQFRVKRLTIGSVEK